MNKCLALVLSGLLASSAWSAPRTVTLSLPTMDCLVCPITVKKALGKVEGVSRAEVDFGKRQAIVSFDDAKTNVEALARATRDAGYPSTVFGNAK
ncbi:mercury resistance system periplasmic binding protein MerP [uncultured Aquimonas sp.]|uniref:mercury resistance system periplasmic binding protein MerP n=1 Tax=uncultured Aquimonas sp. TaxID=385483 RepID=UPI00261CCE17|nr:mercury resistance system periplasmic binding protein MerP [uncultured Aquimonas sp.]